MASLLKEKHENAGRSYPRPRSSCEECSGSLVLCWGNIHEKPYFRHISSNRSGCKGGGGESAFHSLTKELLCNYLNQGGRIEYSTLCEQCSRFTHSLLPLNEKEQWKEEVSYSTIRFDLAAVVDNEVKTGIEIYVSHRTLSTEERNKILWIEVDYSEILSLLDANELPTKIILKNIQTISTCSLSYCMPLFEIAKRLGYLSENERWQLKCKEWNNSLWEAFLVRGKCLRCSLPAKTSKGKPFCISCYYSIHESLSSKGEKDPVNLNDLSISTIAQDLGYLFSDGKWLLIPLVQNNEYMKTSALWDTLRKIGRCIRCEKRYNVSRGKPYCLRCYKELVIKK